MIYAGDADTTTMGRTIGYTASTLRERAHKYLIIVLLWN